MFQNNFTNCNIHIILPIVFFYGCETWSLTLREKRGLKMFKNRVLRRIFGPKRDKVKRQWRKLHNEELNDLDSSPDIVWVIKLRMRWVGHVARMGERRNVYRVLVGKPEGKRPLGRPSCRWDGSSGSGWWGYGLDEAGSGQGQVEGACECGRNLQAP